MQIGGKEYKTGQHIRIVNAKSILHYSYGISGDTDHEMTGVTGTIVSESNYDKNARANLKVDAPWDTKYHNGTTRLYCDDELEIITE